MGVVVVVLPKVEDAKRIRKILQVHGFDHVYAFSSAALALQEMNRHDYGLVFSGFQMKDMHYLELWDSLPSCFDMVVMGSASRADEMDVDIPVLITPLRVCDLVSTAETVMQRLSRKAREGRRPKKRNEREQNYIRNAKFLLMERHHMTEEEAHRYIQKSSMDNGTNMVETAQMILTLLLEEV